MLLTKQEILDLAEHNMPMFSLKEAQFRICDFAEAIERAVLAKAGEQEPDLFVKFDANGEFVTARRNQKGLVFDCDASYVAYYREPVSFAPKPQDCCSFWRNDAIENAALIAERYTQVYCAQDIRNMKRNDPLPAQAIPEVTLSNLQKFLQENKLCLACFDDGFLFYRWNGSGNRSGGLQKTAWTVDSLLEQFPQLSASPKP